MPNQKYLIDKLLYLETQLTNAIHECINEQVMREGFNVNDVTHLKNTLTYRIDEQLDYISRQLEDNNA